MENYRRIFPRNFNMASNNLNVPSGGTPRPDRTNESGDGLQNSMSNVRADGGRRPDCAGGTNPGKKTMKIKQKIRLGTWNIRTINHGCKEALSSECDNYGIDVL